MCGGDGAGGLQGLQVSRQHRTSLQVPRIAEVQRRDRALLLLSSPPPQRENNERCAHNVRSTKNFYLSGSGAASPRTWSRGVLLKRVPSGERTSSKQNTFIRLQLNGFVRREFDVLHMLGSECVVPLEPNIRRVSSEARQFGLFGL